MTELDRDANTSDASDPEQRNPALDQTTAFTTRVSFFTDA